MSRFAVCLGLIACFAVPYTFAQEFTTEQVMAKLDEKAKVFTSVQSSLETQTFVRGEGTTPESGTFAMAVSKGVPRVMMDILKPKPLKTLVDDGKITRYDVDRNTYQEVKFDPKNELLQLLMIGFGTPSATIKKSYNPVVKGTEPMGGKNAVLLELTSTTKETSEYSVIRLWLDPQTWTPLQTRVMQTERKYNDFRFSNPQLNKSVPSSAFDLKKKPGAKKI
jgi:outer membrane lipoprotein-sorting protein